MYDFPRQTDLESILSRHPDITTQGICKNSPISRKDMYDKLDEFQRATFWIACICGPFITRISRKQTSQNLLLMANNWWDVATPICHGALIAALIYQNHTVQRIEGSNAVYTNVSNDSDFPNAARKPNLLAEYAKESIQ